MSQKALSMEMHQIRYFLVLAEELNFTRAAEKCNVAQPSITRAIQMLELELGGALFHRERSSTHLSELGRMMLPYLEQVYREAENAKRHAHEFNRLKKTPLRLGIMCTISPELLLSFIKNVLVRHPGISLQLADDSADALEQALLMGDREVAIYSQPSKPRDDRLYYIPLYREEFVVVAAKGHRLEGKEIVPIEELNDECYLSRVKCEFGSSIDKLFDEKGVEWPTIYESERDDWIQAMAAAGLGLAFMPRLSVTHPSVVSVKMCPKFERDVYLVFVRGRPHSPAVGALVSEAMRVPWAGHEAVAIQNMRSHTQNKN